MVQWIREFRPLGFRERLGMKMIIKYKVVCLVIMLVTFLSFSQTSQAQIAFVSDRDWNYEIYVMDSSGNDLRRLTNHPAYDGQPSWSPDGRQIAFVSERDLNYEVYVTDVDGNNLRNLTNHPVSDFQPDWFNSAGYLVTPAVNLMTIWGQIKRNSN